MSKNFLLFSFVFFSVSGFSQSNKEKIYERSQKIISQLKTKNYDHLTEGFDSSLLQTLSSKQIANQWEMYDKHFGSFGYFGQTNIDTISGFYLSQTIIRYSNNAKMEFRIMFNSKLEIISLQFYPQFGYGAPEYVNSLLFDEYKVNIGKPPYLLEAIFTIPKNVKDPSCVLLVGGSGPQDKDETKGDNKMFKDMAWGLAGKGIAVLRFDKRTFAYGSQLISDKYVGKNLTIKEEYLDDVGYAIIFLKSSKKINAKRIFIAGHDQAGELAPWFAQQNKVCGLIMLAANGRNFSELLTDQLNYLYDGAEINEAARKNLADMKRHALYLNGKKLPLTLPEDSLPFSTVYYWNSLCNYDRFKAAQKLTIPIFILQGERDFEITVKDFDLWKKNLAGKKNVSFKLYPKLNHLFMEGVGRPGREEYAVKANVPEYLVNDLVEWIRSQK
ncbi:MAG: DUF3887 domain-containing protein [Bacteroidia bacterium]